MASIRDVAAEANVSLGTVSKVLNDSALAQISPATRERVRAAARRVGYHPSAIARGLTGKRMDCVGLVMAYAQETVTGDPYLGPCLDGILEVNKQRRQKTVIFTEDTWADALENLPSYCDGHCDGLMLIIPRLDAAIVAALRGRGTMPFVLIGDSRDDSSLITVDVDNVGAARAAVQYLIELGHRRIAAFCGNADFCSNSQRLDGYRQALAGAGIAQDPALVFPGEYWADHGYRNMLALLDRYTGKERPSAVFCFNDGIALGALRACAEQGVSVPGEMSILGFDDIAASAHSQPPLTTVRHPIRHVGNHAAETLLRRINGELEPGHRELIPAGLIIRETAAPPNG